MEGKPQSLDQESLTQSPVKRKSDLVPTEEGEDERTTKQQKPDAPLEELHSASQEEKKGGINLNRNADKEKGKSILSAADKGKGKMVVEDEGSDDEGSQGSGDSGDESDFSDDPLAEIDVDNILPEKTRRRSAVVPGAYLIEGNDDDDDDDDVDVDDDEDDDDAGDEAEAEEEENEDEDVVKQEESKKIGMAEE